MDLKLGEVAEVTNELAEELTGNKNNNKFLINVSTDVSVSLKCLADGNVYTCRNEVFAKNIKWFSDKFDKKHSTTSSSPVPSAKEEPNDISPSIVGKKIKSSGSSEVNIITNDEYVVYPGIGGELKMTRTSSNYSHEENDSTSDDPYGGDGVYG